MSTPEDALALALSRLQEHFAALRQAADDHPVDGESVFTDLYGEGADEMAGQTSEAQHRAHQFRRAWTGGDLSAAQTALSGLSTALARLRERLYLDLVYPRLSELNELGRERGGEWTPWAAAVQSAVEGCLEPLARAERARDRCWERLSERAAGGLEVRRPGTGHLETGHLNIGARNE
ncbi:hypothetical protein [Deinococcus altitudinis]|uniref:hypothetical protein n=1 Tax=Deinococcus altitudinis TaxID=468914 RepID=UPI003891C873